jgi:hypothetical protein
MIFPVFINYDQSKCIGSATIEDDKLTVELPDSAVSVEDIDGFNFGMCQSSVKIDLPKDGRVKTTMSLSIQSVNIFLKRKSNFDAFQPIEK